MGDPLGKPTKNRKRLSVAEMREREGDNTITRNVRQEERLTDEELLKIGLRSTHEVNKERWREAPYCWNAKGFKKMFLDECYTSAGNVYGLGLVIARLLTGNYPQNYIYNEGLSWCEALISHFKRFEERIQAEGVGDQEQVSLTALVSKHMLRMEPDERESAPGCLKRGDFL